MFNTHNIHIFKRYFFFNFENTCNLIFCVCCVCFFYFYITRAYTHAHARAIVLVELEKTYTTYTNKNTLLFFKTGEGFPVFNIYTTYTQHTQNRHQSPTRHTFIPATDHPGILLIPLSEADILHKTDSVIDPSLSLTTGYNRGMNTV